jgi:AcrR family transcriptional regulator
MSSPAFDKWRSLASPHEIVDRNTLRTPQRARGKKRVEHLLDATELVLTDHAQDDISLAHIAEQANVPLPSVYHFFANKNAIFVGLAGRYHQLLRQIAREPISPPPQSWQAMYERRARDAVNFLNDHPAAMRLFMGAGVSVEVRNLDLSGNTLLANQRADDFRTYFQSDTLTDLENWMAVCMGLMDGIWAISYAERGYIDEDCIAESMRAALAYLRCYLPEFLPPRMS